MDHAAWRRLLSRLAPDEYDAKPESIRSSAWTWARKEGLTVKVVIDGAAVFVQFSAGGE